MGKTLHGGERTLILRVLEFFENEKRNHTSRLPVDRVVQRACLATGVSKSTVLRIKREAKRWGVSSAGAAALPTPGTRRKPSNKIHLDRLELCALRDIVDSFYTARREIPTLAKVLAVAKANLDFPGQKSYLRQLLAGRLQYRTVKCKNGSRCLVQKPEIRAWRARYLRRLHENDELGAERKQVIYVGETKIRIANESRQHSEASAKKHNPDRQWVVVHAGGENGFLRGAELIYEDGSIAGDPASFLAHLEDKLIPKLPPRSIVVLGAAPRSARVDRPPALVATEHVIRQWLLDHDVPFDDRMTKSELYNLIRVNEPPKRYAADEALERRGHEVLRLPPAPHMCDLNPIEYIWNVVNARVADGRAGDGRAGDGRAGDGRAGDGRAGDGRAGDGHAGDGHAGDGRADEDGIGVIGEALSSVSASDWRSELARVRALRRRCWLDDRLLEEREAQVITVLRSDDSSSEDSEDGEDEPRLPGDVVQVMMSSSDGDST